MSGRSFVYGQTEIHVPPAAGGSGSGPMSLGAVRPISGEFARDTSVRYNVGFGAHSLVQAPSAPVGAASLTNEQQKQPPGVYDNLNKNDLRSVLMCEDDPLKRIPLPNHLRVAIMSAKYSNAMEPTTVLGLRGYVVHLCRNNPNPIPIIQSIRQCLSRELQLLVFDKEIRDMIDESVLRRPVDYSVQPERAPPTDYQATAQISGFATRHSDIDFTSDDFFGDTKKKKKDDEVKCAVIDNDDSKPAETQPLLTPTKDTDNETGGVVEAVTKDETDNADKTGDDAETDDDEEEPIIEIIEPAEQPMPSLFDDLFVEEEGDPELLAAADNDGDDVVEVPVVAVPPSQRYKIPDISSEHPLFSSAPVGKLDDETAEVDAGEADMKPTETAAFRALPIEVRNILNRAFTTGTASKRELAMLEEFVTLLITQTVSVTKPKQIYNKCLAPDVYAQVANPKLLSSLNHKERVDQILIEKGFASKDNQEAIDVERVKEYTSPTELDGVTMNAEGKSVPSFPTIKCVRNIVDACYRAGNTELGDKFIHQLDDWFGRGFLVRTFTLEYQEKARRCHRAWMIEHKLGIFYNQSVICTMRADPGLDPSGVPDAEFDRIKSYATNLQRADVPGLAAVPEGAHPPPESVAWFRWLIVKALNCRLDTEPIIATIRTMIGHQFMPMVFSNVNFKDDVRVIMDANKLVGCSWLRPEAAIYMQKLKNGEIGEDDEIIEDDEEPDEEAAYTAAALANARMATAPTTTGEEEENGDEAAEPGTADGDVAAGGDDGDEDEYADFFDDVPPVDPNRQGLMEMGGGGPMPPMFFGPPLSYRGMGMGGGRYNWQQYGPRPGFPPPHMLHDQPFGAPLQQSGFGGYKRRFDGPDSSSYKRGRGGRPVYVDD